MIEEIPLTQEDHSSPILGIREAITEQDERATLWCREVNTHIQSAKYKYQTLKRLHPLLTHTRYMTRLDIRKAFWNLLVRTQDRKYLQFRRRHKLYQFRSLVMGIKPSLQIFHRLLKPIQKHIHNKYKNLYTN